MEMTETNIKTLFVVVLFKKDNEVGVVPSSWLKTNSQCYWPDYKTQQRNVKAVINHVKPEEDWPTYDIKVLSSTDSYVKAQDMTKKAEFTDNLETDYDSTGRPKRYKRNRSSSEDESYNPLAKKVAAVTKKRIKLPVFEKMDDINVNDSADSSSESDTLGRNTAFFPVPINSRSPRKSPRNTPRKSPRNTPRKSPKKTPPKKSYSTPISSTKASTSRNLSIPTSEPSAKINKNSGIIKALAEIKTDLKAIKREVSAIRTLIVHKDQTTRTDSIQCQLPVSSDEQLHELETELQCQEQQNVLKRRLISIGGSSLKDGVKRMVTAVTTPSFLSGFNWTGKRTHVSKDRKKCFNELTLCKIVSVSAMNCGFSGPNTLKDIENAIKLYLRSNIDRVNTQQRRHVTTAVLD